MYIITSKNLKSIIGIGAKLDYMSNGYPRLVNENVAFPTEMIDVYEVSYMPEYVEENKYCYTPDQGFFENPNWKEPNKWGIPDDIVQEIKNEAITEVQEGAKNGKM